MKDAKTISVLAAKRERFEAQNGLLPKKEEIKGEVKGEISKAELAEVEQFLQRKVCRFKSILQNCLIFSALIVILVNIKV